MSAKGQERHQAERRLAPTLRRIAPDQLITYLEKEFDSHVKVSFADKEPITVPPGWHGQGKKGEALVTFGEILTKPIAGTELPAGVFTEWMGKEGFVASDSMGRPMHPALATRLLEGSFKPETSGPLVRFTRKAPGRTHIEVEFYHGATHSLMQALSAIGNKDQKRIGEKEKKRYIDAVRGLFEPFISKGTRNNRDRLGLPKTVDVLRRVDDCAASLVTIMGDQLIDDVMQTPRDNLVEVIDVSVATTQAITLAIYMAQRRRVPLILRVGAPAFGLGDRDALNYIMNTRPEMAQYGKLTVGDMGTNMDRGDSATARPFMQAMRRDDEEYREIRWFLGGGRPLIRILNEEYSRRGKPARWDTSVRRASRVDNGPAMWGVLFNGSNMIVRPSRRDKVFLRAGTEFSFNHHMMNGRVDRPGLWVSVGQEKGGYISASYNDRGKPREIFLYAKAPKLNNH